MEMEDIMLNKVSQKKYKYKMISLVWAIQSNCMNEYNSLNGVFLEYYWPPEKSEKERKRGEEEKDRWDRGQGNLGTWGVLKKIRTKFSNHEVNSTEIIRLKL